MSKSFSNQAAVLLALSCGMKDKNILLTKRAEHLSIHSGEVAFPGGKWDPEDQDLRQTALRESFEEVNLIPDNVDIVGELPASYTRNGMKVTPYVGQITKEPDLTPNPGELDSLFWLPIDYLIRDSRARTDIFTRNGKEYWAPVYEYKGYTIWGFTARVLVEFINRFYDAGISRQNSAPIVCHS